VGATAEDDELDARVADRAMIRDAVATYLRGVDRLDADLIDSTYHEDAVDERGRGGWAPGSPAVHLLAYLTEHCVSSYHLLGQQHITFPRGAVARCESYVVAHLVLRPGADGGPLRMVRRGLRYLDRFEDRGGWRVSRRRLVCDWETEGEDLRGDGATPSHLAARRDTGDPSYVWESDGALSGGSHPRTPEPAPTRTPRGPISDS